MTEMSNYPPELKEEEVAAVISCIAEVLSGSAFIIRSFKRVHIYKWHKFAKRDAVNRNEIFNNNWR